MRRFISLLIAGLVFIVMQWGSKELNALASAGEQIVPYGTLALLVQIFAYQIIAYLLLKANLILNSRKLPRYLTGLVSLFLVNALLMWALHNHSLWFNQVFIPFVYIEGIVWMMGLVIGEHLLNH